MSEQEKVSREVAEAEFDLFSEFARLKMDSYRNETAQEKVETCKQHFIEAVMCGRITVDADGHVECHTENDDIPVVRFGRRPIQADCRAMDRVKMNAGMIPIEAKEDAFLASVTGIAPALLGKIEMHDMRLIKEVFHLFLDE